MALFPMHGYFHPHSFDVLNTVAASIKGGEVATLITASRLNTVSETAAYDARDGYNYATPGVRPVATLASTATQFPLFLTDDGSSTGNESNSYFTIFGSTSGSLGLGNGVSVGPNTLSGSGKLTCHATPGLYAVSLDSLPVDFVTSLAGSGLNPGRALGFTAAGKLAHSAVSGAVASTGVARFVSFVTDGTLVRTPAKLVGASSVFTRVQIEFHAGNTATRTL